MSEMLQHALWLASQGFAVVPLHEVRPDGSCTCYQSPCESKPGKHPRTPNGLKNASTDPATIAAWWTKWPTANIAICTGSASKGAVGGAFLLVVDIDGSEGETSFSVFGPMPPTLEARSGKGRHLYFSSPVPPPTKTGTLGLHVDTRGEGGYIIAPPSLHASGARYKWTNLAGIAPAPANVLEYLAAAGASKSAAGPAPLATLDNVHASRSLDEWLRAIETAPPGTKHSTLRDAATAHARAAHEAWEPRADATPRLLNLLLGALKLNPDAPESWQNAEKLVLTALEQAYLRPLPPRLETYEREFNDDALARRFAKYYGPGATGAGARPSACFVPGQGWRVWDGRRWAEQPGKGKPTEFVSEMLIGIQAELERDEDEKLANLIKSKRSAGGMGSVLTLAQRYMSVPYDAFDRDPLLLNCQNGTLDLSSGMLRPHAPSDLLTRMAGVTYDPHARCDAWLRALLQMQRGDQTAVTYLQHLLGSFCQGAPIDGFWLMYGNGFDGKTTVLRVLLGVLGEYAASAAPGTILVSKNGTQPHTSLIGGLAGRRLAMIDELPSDCQLDTGAIKRLYGSVPLRVQTGMGKDFVDVRPTAKGLAASNHLPRVDENDYGTRRRLAVIPFDADLKALGVRKDDSFAPGLVAQEGPGILGWLVAGCRAWRASGERLPECARVDAATAELFTDDVVGRFLATCNQEDPAVRTTAAALYAAFKMFAEAEGEYVISKRTFGNRLRERGLAPHRDMAARYYLGVALPTPTSPTSRPN